MGIEPTFRLYGPDSPLHSVFRQPKTSLTRANVILYRYTVSSVHKLPGKPNWICFYTDHKRRRRCKSTKTTDKREADRVCNELQRVEDKARSGHLTPERARKVIETAVSEIMTSLGVPL